ncbi:T3SS (YopN, CesT) and YbjN peptide-binding chaperone 1 [Intrasporangium calvum]|uniref:TY-Chap central domain-containing protein n=1 Tax=Intrasporangium calvum (strain ATCC 23552 / DSM 43043 / JCM 3097 / NBRC 12989 / NCIMB 10167 / NRRL B-3866 / 7 KIP) TaxID=710696 RepID=E6SFX4_INTC7|nr:hypothetical protein [Intrasporangium calvum]ADU48903.1 hypothetical protein Intca_2396 [Intrasporangium calvum DSM 43043]
MTDPTSLPNFQPHVPAGPPNGAASETPVRDRILAALADLGVEAKVDKDGDLEFSVNDQTLFARAAEGEIPLVRFFGQWQLQEPVPADRNERLARCNDMTLQLNVVKMCLVQESLVVSAEHVVPAWADLKLLTPLSINHILQAVQFFFQSWLPADDQPQPGVDGSQQGGV